MKTDHHPLPEISKKEIGERPQRLERLFLRLLKYNFELRFVSGKEVVGADTLWGNPSQTSSQKTRTYVEVHAVGIHVGNRRSKHHMARPQAVTDNDTVLQHVISACSHRGL